MAATEYVNHAMSLGLAETGLPENWARVCCLVRILVAHRSYVEAVQFAALAPAQGRWLGGHSSPGMAKP